MYQTNNKLLLATFLLPILPLLLATACFAEQADRNKPINLEADQVLMDDAQQISTFTGNVRLSQGTLLIRGIKIVVTQDNDGFKHVSAYGNTAEFRQKREGLDEYVEGYGKRIEYDTHTETLNLYEQARLKRNLDEVRGEHITYSAKTEIFQVNSGSSIPGNAPPQRVHAVMQPKPKENIAPPSAPVTLPVTPNSTPAPTK
jgi:lipopolysaccharide export system protein LptA